MKNDKEIGSRIEEGELRFSDLLYLNKKMQNDKENGSRIEEEELSFL
jgi:hypothetical protein